MSILFEAVLFGVGFWNTAIVQLLVQLTLFLGIYPLLYSNVIVDGGKVFDVLSICFFNFSCLLLVECIFYFCVKLMIENKTKSAEYS